MATREKIISNKAQCAKCNDVIESNTRHAFVTCKCGAISVDGGKEYLRRVGWPQDIIELSEVEEVTIRRKTCLDADW